LQICLFFSDAAGFSKEEIAVGERPPKANHHLNNSTLKANATLATMKTTQAQSVYRTQSLKDSNLFSVRPRKAIISAPSV
jgi:hypothetical protein